MFSATRLNVFVCIALGLAANAAPASVGSAANLGTNANVGQFANLGLTGNAGTSSNVNSPEISDLTSSLGLSTSTSVDKRQILEDIFGQGSDLLNEFGLGGLSGGASASTGTTTNGTNTDTSTSGFGSLFGSGLGGSSSSSLGTSFGLRSEVEKRQILEDIFGQGTALLNEFGLGGLSGGASTSAGTSTNGTTTDTSASGFGSLFGAGLGGSSSSSFGLRSEVEKRQILEDIFGQGTNLLNEFGLSGLSGGASASTGTNTNGTTTNASTGTSASGLGSLFGSGLGGSSSSSLGTSFGLRSEVEKRQILEDIFGQGSDLLDEFGLGGDVEKRQFLEELGLGTDHSVNEVLSPIGFFNTGS